VPKILFVTCHLPYPLISGGRRREYELIRRLASDHEIHLLALTKTFQEDVSYAAVLKDLCSSVAVLPVEPTDDRSRPSQVRRHACREAIPRVRRAVDDYAIDVVHVEGFYLMQHVPDDLGVPIFLQEQNIEYLLWKQRAERGHRSRETMDALWEYMCTIETEMQAWRRADVCGAVTPEDLEVMRRTLPAPSSRLVPDGFDHLEKPDRSTSSDQADCETPVAVFVANFAYQPNVDAALYLGERIWPLISRRMSTARLILVGNAPPPAVEALAAGSNSVIVTGRVPDVCPYLDRAHVVLCPLRVGGGVKVKILEALSRGKAIVTTTIGAQGIPAAERSMRVVDDPVAFASSTLEILGYPELRVTLETRAAAAALQLPTWDDAAHVMAGCYEELLGVDPTSGFHRQTSNRPARG
jgi:polysaccharide biosynthesis protein PslH